MKIKLLILLSLIAVSVEAKHNHFKVSVYVRAAEVQKMKDTQWLESSWATISSQLDVDKIYLETHRDMLIVDDATIEKAKKYLEGQHVAVIIASFFCHLVKSNLCNLCCYQLKAFSTESICDIA